MSPTSSKHSSRVNLWTHSISSFIVFSSDLNKTQAKLGHHAARCYQGLINEATFRCTETRCHQCDVFIYSLVSSLRSLTIIWMSRPGLSRVAPCNFTSVRRSLQSRAFRMQFYDCCRFTCPLNGILSVVSVRSRAKPTTCGVRGLVAIYLLMGLFMFALIILRVSRNEMNGLKGICKSMMGLDDRVAVNWYTREFHASMHEKHDAV